ncbi:hypothetical protein SteCoe_4007 [Stentor coeruleus]|uniref:ribose-phosphate diphosphokinase n=1 Tax=Stentor coeruleus TaxID=5963 RepID=A0A1R2BXS7_9CILI|nr:hypothetical protein SteCoe_17929 [Stentor coeruleus]OMJ93067.1 hypothetical protein SteCoe_4007 [Stentor coeruleus]
MFKFLPKALGCLLAGSTALNMFEGDPYWRSKAKQTPSYTEEAGFLIFSGNSNRPLAREVASYLGCNLANAKVSRFADGEINLQVYDHSRGKDIYIIQSTCPPVNEHLMELLLMVSTLRRSSANKITAVIPYYGYARQDRKMMSRVPISAADVAKLLETMGVDRVIACDLHCGQIQGFFGPRVPVDNLECSIVALNFFRTIDLINPVVISPDAGGVYRAKKFQSFLNSGDRNSGLAMIIKQRLEAGKIEQMDLVGQVNGCDCIIVDDIIDTAGTLCQAAEVLKKYGARKVFAFATHGLFSREAVMRIEQSPLDQVIITNTIPLPGNVDTEIASISPKASATSGKIKQISVGLLIAEAIRRAHLKESFEKLFYPKSFEGDS